MEKTFYSGDHVFFLHFDVSGMLHGYLQRTDSPIRQALKGIYSEQDSGFILSFFIERTFGEELNILVAFSGVIATASDRETLHVNFLTVSENFSKIEDPVQGKIALSTEKPTGNRATRINDGLFYPIKSVP